MQDRKDQDYVKYLEIELNLTEDLPDSNTNPPPFPHHKFSQQLQSPPKPDIMRDLIYRELSNQQNMTEKEQKKLLFTR